MSVQYTCKKCGNTARSWLNAELVKCPTCGVRGTMIESRYFEAHKEQEAERLQILEQLGVEPVDWKVVGVAVPLFGESQNAKKVQTILNDQANEGWEFVFFGESPRLVDGPILIFKRKKLEPLPPELNM